jgi:hypothetical protein
MMDIGACKSGAFQLAGSLCLFKLKTTSFFNLAISLQMDTLHSLPFGKLPVSFPAHPLGLHWQLQWLLDKSEL